MIENLLSKIGVNGVPADALSVIVILLLTFLFAHLAKALFSGVFARVSGYTKTDLDDNIVLVTKPMIVKLVYLAGIGALSNHLEGKYEWYSGLRVEVVSGILFSLLVILIAVYLIRLVTTFTDWYSKSVAIRTESTFDDELMPLLKRVGRIAVGVVAAMIILDHFNVDIKGLVAVLGVGSLAIALAAQETLSNMIAGFVVMVDRPFRKGDRVILGDGTKCDVYQIGMRSTKFLTFENTLVIVPNAELIKMIINNLTYPEPRIRVKVDVGVAYGSDIDVVEKILLDIAEKHPLVIAEPPPSVFFTEMADSSLNFSLVGRVQKVTDQWPTTLQIRAQIYKRFNTDGIEIPFPQRVVHHVYPEKEETPKAE
jgi:MscS family membrane protein